MKRALAMLVAGIALGSTPLASSAGQNSWQENGVFCWTTGSGSSRGVACRLKGSRKVVIVNQRSIIVGSRGKVVYVTSAR